MKGKNVRAALLHFRWAEWLPRLQVDNDTRSSALSISRLVDHCSTSGKHCPGLSHPCRNKSSVYRRWWNSTVSDASTPRTPHRDHWHPVQRSLSEGLQRMVPRRVDGTHQLQPRLQVLAQRHLERTHLVVDIASGRLFCSAPLHTRGSQAVSSSSTEHLRSATLRDGY